MADMQINGPQYMAKLRLQKPETLLLRGSLLWLKEAEEASGGPHFMSPMCPTKAHGYVLCSRDNPFKQKRWLITLFFESMFTHHVKITKWNRPKIQTKNLPWNLRVFRCWFWGEFSTQHSEMSELLKSSVQPACIFLGRRLFRPELVQPEPKFPQ